MPKLALPSYQTTFEHVLFGYEGGTILAALFKNPDDPLNVSYSQLLFDFIYRGTDELLSKGPKAQRGAAFLLYIHFRLCHLVCLYSWPNAQERLEVLIDKWSRLITKGKKNPALAKMLGENIRAALPVIDRPKRFIKYQIFCKC